jgi:hypothetical protein
MTRCVVVVGKQFKWCLTLISLLRHFNHHQSKVLVEEPLKNTGSYLLSACTATVTTMMDFLCCAEAMTAALLSYRKIAEPLNPPVKQN